MRHFILLLSFCVLGQMAVLSEEWSGAPCPVSLSFDETYWTVVPPEGPLLLALEGDGSSDGGESAKQYINVFCIPSEDPGPEFSEAEKDSALALFEKFGGRMTDTSDKEVQGHSAYVISGILNMGFLDVYEIKHLLVKVDGSTLIFDVYSKSYKEDVDQWGFAESLDVLNSIQFPGAGEPEEPDEEDPEQRYADIFNLPPLDEWISLGWDDGLLTLLHDTYTYEVVIAVVDADEIPENEEAAIEKMKREMRSAGLEIQGYGVLTLWERTVAYVDAKEVGSGFQRRMMLTPAGGKGFAVKIAEDETSFQFESLDFLQYIWLAP